MHRNLNEVVVRRIKEKRLENGKTQKDLAVIVGKSAAAISDLERGKVQITVSDLGKISNYLNVPMNEFFDSVISFENLKDISENISRLSPDEKADMLKEVALITKFRRIKEINILSDDHLQSMLSDLLSYNDFLNDHVNRSEKMFNVIMEELKLRRVKRKE